MIFYHVVSDRPKYAGQRFLVDEAHPNGVYDRVQDQMDIVEDIYANPEKYQGTELSHSVDVALRELALEKDDDDKYQKSEHVQRNGCKGNELGRFVHKDNLLSGCIIINSIQRMFVQHKPFCEGMRRMGG